MTTIDCFGDEFRVQCVAATWISWFLPRHSFLFWFKFIGSEPFWKATGRGGSGAARWVQGLGWGILFQGLLGQNLRVGKGVGSCCCLQGIDFFERCICKHSDDFVEFCEFQSSIKQPAISKVQCLILDKRQATSSLAGCLATYCSLIGQIGSASQRVTSLWNEGLNALHQVWASYFQSGPTFSDSIHIYVYVYIYIYMFFCFFLFSRESRRNI